jgi:hypothetical protein
MPLGGPYLAGDVIAVIRQWITDGAMRSGAAAAAASAFTVSSVAPSANEVLHESPVQVMIGFTQDLDLTRIDAESATIEHLMSAEGGAPTETLQARVTVPSVNPRVLLLWPARPLTPGRYRVVLRRSPGSPITDIAGAPLDAGDDPVTLFVVEGTP